MVIGARTAVPFRKRGPGPLKQPAEAARTCGRHYLTTRDCSSLKLTADSAGRTMSLLPVKALPAVPAPAPARAPIAAPLPPPAIPPIRAPRPAPPPVVAAVLLPLPLTVLSYVP